MPSSRAPSQIWCLIAATNTTKPEIAALLLPVTNVEVVHPNPLTDREDSDEHDQGNVGQ
uniref:Uncharacterized protein n=1 Tax=Arundo donax TaxID=35708 RepID=A0A0A9T8W5_ARUDO